MKALLDTHALIWAVDDPSRIGPQAMAVLQDPAAELVFSAGSAWELAIKVALGKLTLSLPYRKWVDDALCDLRASLLPITVEHADAQTRMPSHHRDPFDRLLIAQATVENLALISGDIVFDQYGVSRVW